MPRSSNSYPNGHNRLTHNWTNKNNRTTFGTIKIQICLGHWLKPWKHVQKNASCSSGWHSEIQLKMYWLIFINIFSIQFRSRESIFIIDYLTLIILALQNVEVTHIVQTDLWKIMGWGDYGRRKASCCCKDQRATAFLGGARHWGVNWQRQLLTSWNRLI